MTTDSNEAWVQSVVRRPWEFACAWYDVESIHHGINHDKSIVPADVYSREFAEFLAEQYRLAMVKGAELAVAEMRTIPCVHDLVKKHNEAITADFE